MSRRLLVSFGLLSVIVAACADSSGSGSTQGSTEPVTQRSSKLVGDTIHLVGSPGPFGSTGLQGPFSADSNSPGIFGTNNPGQFSTTGANPGPFVGPGGAICSDLCSFVAECFGADVPQDCATECNTAFTQAAADIGAFPCVPELLSAVDCVLNQITCTGGEIDIDDSIYGACAGPAQTFAQCLGVSGYDLAQGFGGSNAGDGDDSGLAGASGDDSGLAGASGDDGGTATAGPSCTQLAACCPSLAALSADSETQCQQAASAGPDSACATDLQQLQAANYCN